MGCHQFTGQIGTYNWSSTSGGDGGPGPVNVLTFKDDNISVVYTSSAELDGFSRFQVAKGDDAAKAATTLTRLKPELNGKSILGAAAGYMSFLPVIALNRADPRKMAIGGNQLFIGTDDLTVNTKNDHIFAVTSI